MSLIINAGKITEDDRKRAKSDFNKRLGHMVCIERRSRGILAVVVARALGVSRATYMCKERGEIVFGVHELMVLATAWGLSIDCFINHGTFDDIPF